MGYFRHLTEESFKSANNGNTVFYPWGRLGKGYVVPDRECANRIRRLLVWYHFCALATLLVVSVFLGHWLAGLLVVLPAVILGWWLLGKRAVRGMKAA